MQAFKSSNKRVIVVYWKDRPEDPFEVFSSLKNFCLSYKKYNYNTLSNYLSKRKTFYENEVVRVERKNVFLKPITFPGKKRSIIPVVRSIPMQEADDYMHDLTYWLTKTPFERLSAVTFLIRQSLRKGEKLDKSRVVKKKLKN